MRCRRNGLANAPFPLPILCPADGVEPVDGVLPDLGFVEGCCDARQSCLNLLPYVGPGWYPKVSLAAMLDLGVCRWDHIVLGISARSHVDAATLRRALERMDAAWPESEEHMAKLSVNAMIGLWARSTEVVYSVCSSSSELDGAGADFSQAFAYEGGMVWDFVYVRRLLSNGTYRPIHYAVLGFEHCMVAKARRILDAPPRYLAQVKTDCLLTQRLPKRFAERLRALEALRHPDGTPVYRVEETKPLLGSRKTHLARTIVARLREQGEAVHLVSKTHCSAQNLGLGAQTADHWVRRYVRGGSAQKLDWLVVEEITQLDFRQLPAVLDSWAGRPISAPLEHSQLIRDLAGGHRHERPAGLGGEQLPGPRLGLLQSRPLSARPPAASAHVFREPVPVAPSQVNHRPGLECLLRPTAATGSRNLTGQQQSAERAQSCTTGWGVSASLPAHLPACLLACALASGCLVLCALAWLSG